MYLFPRAVAEIIEGYCEVWKLQHTDNICKEMLNYDVLCSKNAARAGDLLMEDPSKIVWTGEFSRTVTSFDLVRANLDKIWLCGLTKNPHMIRVLLEHPNLICNGCIPENPADEAVAMICEDLQSHIAYGLSRNSHPLVIEYLREHPDQVDWNVMCANTNPLPVSLEIAHSNWLHLYFGAMMFELFKDEPDLVDWYVLSKTDTPEAIEMLKKYPDRIHWSQLSANPHPWAVEQLQTNPEKIDRRGLAANSHPWALPELFKRGKSTEEINILSGNPGIFALARDFRLISLLSLGDPNSYWISTVMIADGSVMSMQVTNDSTKYIHCGIELETRLARCGIYIDVNFDHISRTGSFTDEKGNETKMRERFSVTPGVDLDHLQHINSSDRYTMEIHENGVYIIRIVYKTTSGITKQDITDPPDEEVSPARFIEEYVIHKHIARECSAQCKRSGWEWREIAMNRGCRYHYNGIEH